MAKVKKEIKPKVAPPSDINAEKNASKIALVKELYKNIYDLTMQRPEEITPKRLQILDAVKNHDFDINAAAKELAQSPKALRSALYKVKFQNQKKQQPPSEETLIVKAIRKKILKDNTASETECLALWETLKSSIPEKDLNIFKIYFLKKQDTKTDTIAREMGVTINSFFWKVKKVINSMQRIAKGESQGLKLINHGKNFTEYREFVAQYLEEAKKVLSQAQYEATRMFFIEGTTQKEIANQAGASSNAIHLRITDALKKLQKTFANVK